MMNNNVIKALDIDEEFGWDELDDVGVDDAGNSYEMLQEILKHFGNIYRETFDNMTNEEREIFVRELKIKTVLDNG